MSLGIAIAEAPFSRLLVRKIVKEPELCPRLSLQISCGFILKSLVASRYFVLLEFPLSPGIFFLPPQQYVNEIYWPFEIFNVMPAMSSVSGHRTLSGGCWNSFICDTWLGTGECSGV